MQVFHYLRRYICSDFFVFFLSYLFVLQLDLIVLHRLCAGCWFFFLFFFFAKEAVEDVIYLQTATSLRIRKNTKYYLTLSNCSVALLMAKNKLLLIVLVLLGEEPGLTLCMF